MYSNLNIIYYINIKVCSFFFTDSVDTLHHGCYTIETVEGLCERTEEGPQYFTPTRDQLLQRMAN